MLLIGLKYSRGFGGSAPSQADGLNTPDLNLPDDPKLAHNITHFARALRKAGLPMGPGRVIDAIRAVEAAGFTASAIFTGRCTPVS